MSKNEMLAIKKLVSAVNTLTSAWYCEPLNVVVDRRNGDYSVTIECPACSYAIYIASFLSNVGLPYPRVNGKKVFII